MAFSDENHHHCNCIGLNVEVASPDCPRSQFDKDTLLRVIHSERPVPLDEAARSLRFVVLQGSPP